MPLYRPAMPSDLMIRSVICIELVLGLCGEGAALKNTDGFVARFGAPAKLEKGAVAGVGLDEGPTVLACPSLRTAALRPAWAARSMAWLSSCKRVLTTQIGFVAVAVTMPAVAAAQRWTTGVSLPPLKWSAMSSLPLPYVKKLIDRAGTTPTSVGPRPLKSALGPSLTEMSLWRSSQSPCTTQSLFFASTPQQLPCLDKVIG